MFTLLQQLHQQQSMHINKSCNAAIALAPVVAMIGVGNELIQSGDYDEAICAFATAQSALTSTTTSSQAWTIAAEYLQTADNHLMKSRRREQGEDADSHSSISFASPPDLYQEDECDVGPRILSTPLAVDEFSLTNRTLLEAILLFNKALALHLNGNLHDSRSLYEVVAYSVQTMVGMWVGPPSCTFLELAMRSHNNLGLASYVLFKEGIASASFEAAAQFAAHLAPFSKAHRLEYATVLSNWCRVNWMRGDISNTLYESLKDVLRIRAALLSWDHPDVAAARYNVAVAAYTRQDGQNAVAQLTQYLAAAKHRSSEHSKDDLDVIPAMIYLLLIQHEEKEDQASSDLTRGLRTLQDRRQDMGPHSLEVASVLNYVGTLLFQKKEFDSALIFFQEELRLEDINENILLNEEERAQLESNTSVSVTCNNIGRILQELGQLHEAVTYYNRALETQYGNVSSEDASTADSKCKPAIPSDWTNITAKCDASSANLYSTVWYNLGLIHDKLGNFSDAITAFKMSLELRKILLGSGHPDIACLLYNIGVLQMEQQLLDDASLSFREALRIRRVVSAGQLNDLHLVKTLEKLTSLHKAKGNISKAVEATHEILRIQEITSEYDSLTRMKEMGSTLRSVAELYHAANSLGDAVHMAMDSVNKLRVAADLCVLQQHANISHAARIGNTPSLVDRIASTEQFVSSLLLLGSLYHEINEPLEASVVFKEAALIVAQTIDVAQQCQSITVASSLHALQEVTNMLSLCPCAPVA
jgi:tetratricopeptide (TPR) repeat protein